MNPSGRLRHREERWLHPFAWWIWAIGVAAAVSQTSNPIVLLLLGLAVANVVYARRLPGSAGRAFGVFVRVAAFVVLVRLVLAAVIGARVPGTVIVTLPSVGLPSWMAGIALGGPVTAEQLATAAYGGLRLGAIVACFGAVNSVCSPYRLVRSFPAVLHEAGLVIAVGVSLAPMMVIEVGRVRAARRLRGRPAGIRGVRGTVLPVLESALESAVHRAAAMDSRGYGRRASVAPRRQRQASTALLVGVVGVTVGSYALLDGSAPSAVRLPSFVVGVGALVVGLRLAGARSLRTVYRPDPWNASEWMVAVSGIGAILLVAVAARNGGLEPSVRPMSVPLPPLTAMAAAAFALLPMVAAPPVPGSGRDEVDRLAVPSSGASSGSSPGPSRVRPLPASVVEPS